MRAILSAIARQTRLYAMLVLALTGVFATSHGSATPLECSALFETRTLVPRVSLMSSYDFVRFEERLHVTLLEKVAGHRSNLKILVVGLSHPDLSRASEILTRLASRFPSVRIEAIVYAKDANTLLELSAAARPSESGGRVRYRFETADFSRWQDVRRADIERPDFALQIVHKIAP